MKYNKNEKITDDMNAPREHIIKPGNETEILEALAGSLTGSISVYDEDSNFCFLSSATYKNLELSPDEIKVGDSLDDYNKLLIKKGLVTPKSLEAARASETQVERGGNGEVFTHMVRYKNGALKRITRRKLTNGLTVNLTCDISSLHEKTEFLEETLRLGKSAYWIYDIASKTYEISNTFWSFLGDERLEAFNKHGVFMLLHKEDQQRFKDALAHAIKTNSREEVVTRHTLNAKHSEINKAKGRNSHYIWAKTNFEVVRNDEGQPIKIQAFV